LLTAGGTIVFAAVTLTLAYVRIFWVLCGVMAVGGAAWITLMAGLNVAVQTLLPSWVRARGLAIYLLVSQGGMVVGSLAWGTLAQQAGIAVALAAAAAGQVFSLLVMLRFRLPPADGLDLAPSLHWPQPTIVIEPNLEEGPVLVTIEYRIDPEQASEFVRAMEDLRFIRRRDGAFYWGLYQDMADPSRYVETFMVESWAEHLRQHDRITVADRAVQERAQAFHSTAEPPRVSHLLAQSEPRTPRSGK
jgi:MFS family permease